MTLTRGGRLFLQLEQLGLQAGDLVLQGLYRAAMFILQLVQLLTETTT